ncbi:MAG TPA: hypothetical protein VLL28_13655, partial [Hyphomicrobiaceae bacterium]|nr:hypothetical protein [Hyphomicrobiaceae bacterium]
ALTFLSAADDCPRSYHRLTSHAGTRAQSKSGSRASDNEPDHDLAAADSAPWRADAQNEPR